MEDLHASLTRAVRQAASTTQEAYVEQCGVLKGEERERRWVVPGSQGEHGNPIDRIGSDRAGSKKEKTVYCHEPKHQWLEEQIESTFWESVCRQTPIATAW